MHVQILFRQRGFHAFHHSPHLHLRNRLLSGTFAVGAGRQRRSHHSFGHGLSKLAEGLLPKDRIRMPHYINAIELPDPQQPRFINAQR